MTGQGLFRKPNLTETPEREREKKPQETPKREVKENKQEADEAREVGVATVSLMTDMELMHSSQRFWVSLESPSLILMTSPAACRAGRIGGGVLIYCSASEETGGRSRPGCGLGDIY